MKNFNKWAVCAGVLLFVAVRFFGLHIPYHQDEYKWAMTVAKGSPLVGSITHPPLDELTYTVADRLFGNTNLRVLPLIFFLLDSLLLFYFMKWRFGKREACAAAALFAASFYSVLASLMVDTDGQVVPFVFLLLAVSYFKWKEATVGSREKKLWGAAFILVTVVGMLIKVSFAIAVGAFILEFLISERKQLSWRRLLPYIGVFCGTGLAIVVFLVFIAPLIFLDFNIMRAVAYWGTFVSFTHRNFFQTLIEVAKATMYLSPLLLLSPFFLRKDDAERLRSMFLFILAGLCFYLVLFDFSSGALDRYLEFLIVPLSMIGGVALSRLSLKGLGSENVITFSVVFLVSLLPFVANFLPQSVPSLYPKSEWLQRIFSLHWNFLFPFTGGSGPLGFYVSFGFIACSSLVAAAFLLLALRYKKHAQVFIFGFLVVGVVYNAVFAEEYIFGKMNGNAGSVLYAAEAFIASDNDITKVVNYNDTGTYELTRIGKEGMRLYVAPQFATVSAAKLETLKEFYLVVDIPRIDPTSVYASYLASCPVDFRQVSQAISATVYDCRKASYL